MLVLTMTEDEGELIAIQSPCAGLLDVRRGRVSSVLGCMRRRKASLVVTMGRRHNYNREGPRQ